MQHYWKHDASRTTMIYVCMYIYIYIYIYIYPAVSRPDMAYICINQIITAVNTHIKVYRKVSII